MTESQIQSKIIKRYELDGWYVIKIIQCNKNGISDLIAFKNSKAIFIEVKKPGKKLRPLQEYRKKELKNYGFDVLVLTE